MIFGVAKTKKKTFLYSNTIPQEILSTLYFSYIGGAKQSCQSDTPGHIHGATQKKVRLPFGNRVPDPERH